MKMVIAVVQDYDCDRFLTTLSEHGIRATRLASMGGFLRSGNTTILMGADEAWVPTALDILRTTCRSRTISALGSGGDAATGVFAAEVADVHIGGAVVFVAPVSRFERIPVVRTTSSEG